MSHKRNWKCAINVLMVIMLYMYILCRPVVCRYFKRSAQCKAVSVPSCPQSSNAWRFQARERCLNEEMYHCLITELHNPGKPDFMECCMPNVNITSGHMPRYSRSRDEIQEINCEDNFFMDTIFASNRFRDNGVEHCKYLKSNCMMEGMKICSEGTTAEDRMCYCDYRNKWVPELPLTDGSHCFFVKDNRCHLVVGCDKPYQELNMMYKCVNACDAGFSRPEHLMDCIPDTTTSIKDTTMIPIAEKSTPIRVTPGITSDGGTMAGIHDSDKTSTLPVGIVVGIAFAGIVVAVCGLVVIFLFKGKPSIVIHRPFIPAKKGEPMSIECSIQRLAFLYSVSELYWTKAQNKQNAKEERIVVKESEGKYKGADYPKYPSLVINNVEEVDQGFYYCELKCHLRGPFCKIRKMDRKITSTCAYLVVSDSASRNNLETNMNPEILVVGDQAQITYNCNNGISGIEKLKEQPKKEVKILEPAYYVKPRDTTHLEVEMTNFLASEVTWFKKKKQHEQKIKVFRRFKGSTIEYPHLIIRKVRASDEGFYYCTVKAEDGESIKSNYTYLIPVANDSSKIQNQLYINKVNQLHAGKETATALLRESKCDESDYSSAFESENEQELPTAMDDIQLHNTDLHTVENRFKQIQENNAAPENDNIISNVLSELQRRAAELGYDVQDVAKDGNCFFHAVSQQMTENLRTNNYDDCLGIANELRNWVVAFLRENNETPQGVSYSSFTSSSFNSYLEQLSEPGVYADEICLNAVCHCLQVKICVLSTGNSKKFIEYVPNCQNPPVIYLGHLHNPETKDGFHYVRLVPKDAKQEIHNQKESSV